MGKKKTENDLDSEVFGEFDNKEGLEDLRKEEQKANASLISTSSPTSDDTSSEDLAERLSQELIEPQRDFKYLKISVEQEENGTEFYVHVIHQSHGFMNYLITKVLKCKGVEFAAYKNTSLEPPVMYVRTDGSKEIKNILKEALKLMRIDWKGMGNAVSQIKS
ncbi:RpoL/Rpb11 RNA polymerase subunit family protein [Promethearchaeum syntrophicum]|uniref:RpoL/Rpb11 RNA polymerase subunit family protein n=1 Tax=Promethearchaeum syntrophicum TaxID=2594042 RepID=A0A5B9D637_9ARCH|nr:RpoL/Rpb11 RNA polymerase subunit family protein [Candidatus Prometheoarchaeum syntrophicum]QEE14257.1 DNA-directed RNA polymerase subunit L [Candidatus Prometheoarchaeum syntrophicum]